MSNVIFHVGDWSSDGHGYCAEFLVTSNKSLQELREIHFKENEFIGSLCEKYEENKISLFELLAFMSKYSSSEDLAKLQVLALIQETASEVVKDTVIEDVTIEDGSDYSFDEEDDHFVLVPDAQSMLSIWLFLLKTIDSDLIIENVSVPMSRWYIKYKGYPATPDGDLVFSGYDSKGRHLETPGYGVWDCDEESEFCTPN